VRRTVLKNLKMSGFADHVFKQFSNKHGQPILLKKSEYHRLIDYIDKQDIPEEVAEKLDLIVEYLQWEDEGV